MPSFSKFRTHETRLSCGRNSSFVLGNLQFLSKTKFLHRKKLDSPSLKLFSQ